MSSRNSAASPPTDGALPYSGHSDDVAHAAAALRLSEERYRLAAETARLGTWTWDLQSDVVVVDARVRALFGLDSHEPISRAQILASHIHPDDLERVTQALAAAADPAGDGRYDVEHRVVRRDGSVRWALAAGQVQFVTDGARRIPTVMLGTVVDITERRQADAARQSALADAERARAEAEAARSVASALVESVRDAFVAYDADFRFTYVNDAAAAIFAASGSDHAPIGQVLWDAYPRLVGTPVESAMRRAMIERVPVHFETHDPVLRRWHAARIYPAAGGGLTAVWTDVTAERRAREAAAFLAEASRALAASLDYEATLSAVADAAVPRLGDWCAVDIVQDPAAGHWPPTVERLAVVHRDPSMLALGAELTARYPTDWSSGSGLAAVLRDGVPMFVPEVTDEMLVSGARDAEHLAMLRAIRFSSILVVPLVARGLTLGALTLCMTESGRRYDEADHDLALDVAHRAALAVDNARLYREAAKARAEAEQQRLAAESANAIKTKFLHTMSHELRTPLHAIGGYTQLLTLGLRGPLTDSQRQDLERIGVANQHLLSLVNDILNFARVDAGQLEYRIRDVELSPMVAELESLIGPQLMEQGITFDHDGCLADGTNPLPIVRADSEKLRQILLNLLTNAVKFTPSGGRIGMECGIDATTHTVHIAVTDTGSGIPAEDRERIFEPFVQVNRQRTPQSQQGVGLGLAISRELARRMGGDLTVESRVDEGSRFILSLPGRRTRPLHEK